MERALVKCLAQPSERQRFVEMLLDEPADRLHHVGLGVPRERFWTATQASTISCALSRLWRRKELHIFPARPPGGARRPAINSGGCNCENELPVVRSVARHHSVPTLVRRFIGQYVVCLADWHIVPAFYGEYGIHCHSKESLR